MGPFLLFVFVVWLGLASFTSGGLYELKKINPDSAHSSRSVAYLVDKLNYSYTEDEDDGMHDRFHVEQCSLYMPAWDVAAECVRSRILCELQAPRRPNIFSGDPHTDIFSDEFRQCAEDTRPTRGIKFWLRASRSLWRGAIVYGLLWATGGAGESSDPAWDEKHSWWAEPMVRWMERGQ